MAYQANNSKHLDLVLLWSLIILYRMDLRRRTKFFCRQPHLAIIWRDDGLIRPQRRADATLVVTTITG